MKIFLKAIATTTLLAGFCSSIAAGPQKHIYQHPIPPSLIQELWEATPDTAGRFLPNGQVETRTALCGDLTQHPYDCQMIELYSVDLSPHVPNDRSKQLVNQERLKMVSAQERFSSSGFIAFRQGKAVVIRVDQYMEIDPELYAVFFSDVVVRAEAAGWNMIPNTLTTASDSTDHQVRTFEAGNTKVELVRQKHRLILFYSKVR